MKFNQIKNIFPNSNIARYNVAVWQKSENDSLCFIGREVTKAGEIGEPDNNILKLFEVDKNGLIIQERIIWKPLYDGINLEDPRVLKLANESLVIGLTAVLRDKKGHPVPFPAIVKIDSLTFWKHELPPFLIIDSFGPGKNLTPLDNTTYLFRPNATDYHHKLLVFSLHSQTPEKLGDIDFPKDLPWASWKMGTTMPPLWITPNEALFIIHGISMRKIDGVDKYIYSIGKAKLIRKEQAFQVIVTPEPILTPDDFLNSEGVPLVQELHPELRRVVYSCGGVIKKNTQDILSLYVNVGDRTTFEVELSLTELKKDLF
ncbi:hypothetical protein HY333_01725 [Candidatus Collierbacteria bacterium]|nr:hypothetical protein [Candidatus Collierbacteria bacterium]